MTLDQEVPTVQVFQGTSGDVTQLDRGSPASFRVRHDRDGDVIEISGLMPEETVSGVKSQFEEALVMTLLRTIGLLCLSLLLFVGRADAGLIFHADLLTGTEAGPNSFADPTRGAPTTGPGLGAGASRPLSFGTANFFLNDAGTALSFTATVFNIDFTGSQTPGPNDDLVAAHIHAGGAAA